MATLVPEKGTSVLRAGGFTEFLACVSLAGFEEGLLALESRDISLLWMDFYSTFRFSDIAAL